MSGTINLHVGSVEDMGKRFIGAWHQLEQGAVVDETHLTFLDLETMVSTLSPKRLALLRHVRQQPAENVAVLAKSLGRDYKRVHEDVTVLVHAGLLERDVQGIRAPYDSVHTEVSLV
jgi:predicted transcriptional regulator